MDITTLAATAVVMLVPYLAKGGEKIAESAASDLWELIKKPFQKGNHDELEDLEKDPENLDNQASVRKRLGKILQNDPELVAALSEQLKQMPENSTFKINTMKVKGDHNQNFQDISGTITINKQKDES